jgi:hypothetical protein
VVFEVLFVDNMKQKTTTTITRSSNTTTIRQHGNKMGLQIVPINMCLAAIGLLA